VVGIVGGVASGKTLVSDELARLGAAVINADRLAHEVLEEEEIKQQILDHWGSEVFGPDGKVMRSALGRRVFAGNSRSHVELLELERITHPRIADRIQQQIQILSNRPEVPLIVLDAAVLIKAGWDAKCDHILFVDALAESRWQRARERGWSRDEFEAREAAQESLQVKRSRADVIIDNSGSRDRTRDQIQSWWQRHVRTLPPA
jgi:dephospho-CoA kinase